MAKLKDLSIRTIEDIYHGRHREAYALFMVGVALVALGFADVLSIKDLMSAMLLALSFLVFHTSVEAPDPKPSLDQVLTNRDSFGSFNKLLPGVRDLRVYGPTALAVVMNAADIRRFVLTPGGSARVIVQDDNPEALRLTGIQLDDNLDLARTLQSSVAALERMQAESGFSYRRLPVNPGFSLIIVNANDRRGYVIFESHGFKDEYYTDRMHIVISRADSPHWFSYWVMRFEAMWSAAESPAPETAS
jgi:hypothetical protein